MLEFKFDPTELKIFKDFGNKFSDTVKKSIQNSVEEMAEEVRDTWRAKSDHNDMPGTFSEAWKARKAKLGLRTEDMQRFGRGDSRSYYENIDILRYKPFGGAFVGILKGTPGYKDSGDLSSWTLDKIAEAQEKYHPIWHELLNLVIEKIERKVEDNFKKDMSRLGARVG